MNGAAGGEIRLVCPAHHELLEGDGAALVCRSGGERFPVRDGIPRFVTDDGYAKAFGHQWNRFRLTQLDSHSGLTLTRERLERILGPELWRRLPGLSVLEAGCGAGRFTEVILEHGARLVSLDLSTAVDANATTFPVSDRHTVVQASVYEMPLAPESFDLVLGLGMLQHTPSPERTIAALYSRVRPGGWLALDSYPRSLGRIHLAGLFRLWYKRMPPEQSMSRIERLVDRMLPLHKRVAPHRLAHLALTRFSPVREYFRTLPQLNDAQQREWAVLDTYDVLTDAHKHLRSQAQIERALAGVGAERVECWRGGNGIEARAMRPEVSTAAA